MLGAQCLVDLFGERDTEGAINRAKAGGLFLYEVTLLIRAYLTGGK